MVANLAPKVVPGKPLNRVKRWIPSPQGAAKLNADAAQGRKELRELFAEMRGSSSVHCCFCTCSPPAGNR